MGVATGCSQLRVGSRTCGCIWLTVRVQTTRFLYWNIRPSGQKDGCNLEKHRIPKAHQDDHVFDLHPAQRHYGRSFMEKRGQDDETKIPAQTSLPFLLLLMSACYPGLWLDFGTYFHFWSNSFACFFFFPLPA